MIYNTEHQKSQVAGRRVHCRLLTRKAFHQFHLPQTVITIFIFGNHSMMLLGLLYFIPVLLSAIFYVYIVRPPTLWAQGTTGGLIGEVHVKDEKDAQKLATDATDEAFSLWKEPSSNWELMHNNSTSGKNKLKVEVRRITEGPFKTSGILLTRAEGVVEGVNPDRLYQFLTSVEGLQLLDPNLDPNEADKFIERYDWKGRGKGSHLDIHESFMHEVPPGMQERYYIVLNGYDLKERFFFCKSIVHDSKPGSSIYYDDYEKEATTNNVDPRVRAVNTFYFHMTPTSDNQGTILKMVNYADVRMGSTMLNWMVCNFFYPNVFQSLRSKFSTNQEGSEISKKEQ